MNSFQSYCYISKCNMTNRITATTHCEQLKFNGVNSCLIDLPFTNKFRSFVTQYELYIGLYV